jgi:hypothetical protein
VSCVLVSNESEHERRLVLKEPQYILKGEKIEPLKNDALGKTIIKRFLDVITLLEVLKITHKAFMSRQQFYFRMPAD